MNDYDRELERATEVLQDERVRSLFETMANLERLKAANLITVVNGVFRLTTLGWTFARSFAAEERMKDE